MPQTIFITGAASGIGRETARLFARRGWFVGLFDVDVAKLESLARELGDAPHCLRMLDVGDYGAFREAVSFFAEQAGGRMDVLFNCAGILRMGLFESLGLEEQIRTVRVNFEGMIHGIYASLEILKKTAGAHVVTMGSASGFYGVPEVAVYSASKFAVRGLTEALSLELERHGIVVCDVMPPWVRTPLLENQRYEAGSLRTLGVGLEPAQIADLVWRAAHGRKVHWVPTVALKIMVAMQHLLPFLSRPAMRIVSRVGTRRSDG